MVQTGAVHVVPVGLMEDRRCWWLSGWELLDDDG